MHRRSFAFFALILIATGARGQSPDGRGEVVLDQPYYKGVWADVQIPLDPEMRNEGGSDGAGLCVIMATLIGGRHQGVPLLLDGKASPWWTIAKSRPGGYWPERLKKYLDELEANLIDVHWISWEGASTDLIEEYTRKGYPVACTTNTGILYSMQGIHHFITVIHLDSERAILIDSNDPTHYHAMPRGEFDRRFVDGEMGWMFVWLWDADLPDSTAEVWPAAVLILASGIVVVLGVTL